VLVFTRTKHRAKNLARDLNKKKYRAAELQGNMSQNRRQQAIKGFRGNKYDILVATDVASRGIDVHDISHVINFDMPDTVDAYTHRIGRTGRIEKTGEALTFMAHGDEAIVRDIEKVLGTRIERRRLAGFDYAARAPQTEARKNGSRNGNGHGNGRGNGGSRGNGHTNGRGRKRQHSTGQSSQVHERTEGSARAERSSRPTSGDKTSEGQARHHSRNDRPNGSSRSGKHSHSNRSPGSQSGQGKRQGNSKSKRSQSRGKRRRNGNHNGRATSTGRY
jgi:superfamily II DNA/RNA helicase